MPIPEISTERLRLRAFIADDVPALATILAVPDVSKNITADASSPERCRAAAERRITGYLSDWDRHGYGVWAARAGDGSVAPPGTLLGWCGFGVPEGGVDPELLYGLAPLAWRRGLATEAARAAIDWLFGTRDDAAVSALVFGRLNPGSAAVLRKLGLRPHGTMAMTDFMADRELTAGVLAYEIWRIGHAVTDDLGTLLFQAAHKGGQFATLSTGDPTDVERAFCAAAQQRPDCAAIDPADLDRRVTAAFRLGMAEPYLDHYRLGRADWPGPST